MEMPSEARNSTPQPLWDMHAAPPVGTECECCSRREASIVCPGCWGAQLCGPCLAALHEFIPPALLRRTGHAAVTGAAAAMGMVDAAATRASSAVALHSILAFREPPPSTLSVVDPSTAVTLVSPGRVPRALSPVMRPMSATLPDQVDDVPSLQKRRRKRSAEARLSAAQTKKADAQRSLSALR
jgi:hypothetical protein